MPRWPPAPATGHTAASRSDPEFLAPGTLVPTAHRRPCALVDRQLDLLARIGRPDGFADGRPRWMGNDAEEGYTMDCSAGTCPRDPVGAVADWARAAGDPIFTPEYLAACVPSRCWSWFRHDRYAVEVTLSAEQTWYVLVVTVRGSG